MSQSAEDQGLSPCDALAAAWARVAPPAPVGLPYVRYVIPPVPLQPLPKMPPVFRGRTERLQRACPPPAPSTCSCPKPCARWMPALLIGGALFWIGRASRGR